MVNYWIKGPTYSEAVSTQSQTSSQFSPKKKKKIQFSNRKNEVSWPGLCRQNKIKTWIQYPSKSPGRVYKDASFLCYFYFMLRIQIQDWNKIKKHKRTLSKDLNYAPAQDIKKRCYPWISLAYDILWCNHATWLSFKWQIKLLHFLNNKIHLMFTLVFPSQF